MKKEMLSLNSWIDEATRWQQSLDDFLIDYNMRELECSEEDLLAKMQDMLKVMEKSVEHGLTGWAPTQGHIPSGVPYIGFAREDILAGKVNRAMIIGKGSLFLGRMTNLFDGASFVIQANSGPEAPAGVSEDEVKKMIAKAMREFAATLLAAEE